MQEYLLKLGLPGVVILGLVYALLRVYTDLQKTQNARVEDILGKRDDERRRR